MVPAAARSWAALVGGCPIRGWWSPGLHSAFCGVVKAAEAAVVKVSSGVHMCSDKNTGVDECNTSGNPNNTPTAPILADTEKTSHFII